MIPARVLYLFAAGGLAAITYGGRELVTAEPLDPAIWPWVFALATASCLVAAFDPHRRTSWAVSGVCVIGLACARIVTVFINVADGHVYAIPKAGWLSFGVWVLIVALATGAWSYLRPPPSPWDG